MNSYDQGDPIRVVGTFTDYVGTATDPTTVTLRLYPPVQWGANVPGTLFYDYASGSITKATTGSYYFDINPLPQGTWGVWQYTYQGSGAVNAAFQGAFNVRQGR